MLFLFHHLHAPEIIENILYSHGNICTYIDYIVYIDMNGFLISQQSNTYVQV